MPKFYAGAICAINLGKWQAKKYKFAVNTLNYNGFIEKEYLEKLKYGDLTSPAKGKIMHVHYKHR
jgi:hypothetical protein